MKKTGEKLILTINPGSTSMKLAIFADKQCVAQKNQNVDLNDIVRNYERITLDSKHSLFQMVLGFLEEENIALSDLDAIMSRGGPTPSVQSGAYTINPLMINILKYAPNSKHAAMLGPEIAYRLAASIGIPAMIYDGSTADEGDEVAHITGLPEIRRNLSSHVLNSRMMARELAEKLGIDYMHSCFVVAHLGGGISIGIHKDGKVIDTDYVADGPFSPTRAGRLPSRELLELCYSQKYTMQELKSIIMGRAGLLAYFGTDDARKIESMVVAGDEHAKTIYYAMAYAIAKSIGELSTVNFGKVDGIILTGGLAYSEMLTEWVRERVSFIAPVYVMPGEDEMKALALGGLRVLNGEEETQEYTAIQKGFADKKSFYAAFGIDDCI